MDPNLDKEFAVMILLKRPPYVLLPVELGNDPLFKKSRNANLEKVKWAILRHTVLIVILTSISTTALDQQLHTDHFVYDIHTYISNLL